MIDFVLCYPPMSLPDTPLMGIALLSAILQKNNFECRTVDMNIDLFDSEIYQKSEWDSKVAKFASELLFEEEYRNIKNFVERYVDDLLNLSPKIIGIGVFTKSNEFITKKICENIRSKSPSVKILIGGMYCENVGPKFLETGIIDFYINGPAENLILDIARNNLLSKPGLNNLQRDQVDISNTIPDYSQLDLRKYRSNGLYVVGSRGCPYKCTFCNVKNLWPEYQLRKINEIITEIEFQINKYGTYKFFFSDSLVNGDMKYFRLLCAEMRDLNVKYNNKLDIQWFMSIRNKNQMTESDFDSMIGVGLNTVKLGVESGSPEVLKHMRKGYKLPDLTYFLEQLQRVKIKCDLFFVVGYPTETEKDFEQTKMLLHELVKFKDTINFIRVAACFTDKNTKLEEMGFPIGSSIIGRERYDIFRALIFKLGFGIRLDQLISSYYKYRKHE